MNRLFPAPLLSLALGALWLALNNTLAPGHLLLAALIGWLVPLIGGPRETLAQAVPATRRLWLAARLLGRLLSDIVAANLSVAKRILFVPERALSPCLITVELRLESPVAVAMLAGIVTLTPGTVSADILGDEVAGDESTRRYRLLVHALDAPDPAGLTAEIRGRYEDLLLEMLR
jgi:multicomponent K+:H+ antiporter subunit E